MRSGVRGVCALVAVVATVAILSNDRYDSDTTAIMTLIFNGLVFGLTFWGSGGAASASRSARPVGDWDGSTAIQTSRSRGRRRSRGLMATMYMALWGLAAVFVSLCAIAAIFTMLTGGG